jgi:hypothetical protein
MYQVVIDTNVLVTALLSNRGSSHRLLRLVGDPRWRMNLSVPLVLEYEQTRKRVCTSENLGHGDIDSVLEFLAPMGISVQFSFFFGRCCQIRRMTSSWNWQSKAGLIFSLHSTLETSWVPSASVFEWSCRGNSLP